MTTRPPAGLGAAGRRLWRDMTSTYAFGPHERTILEQAARTLDVIAELEALTATPDATERRLLIAETRQNRAVLARLLAALRVPDDDGTVPQARPPRGTHRLGAGR